MEKIQLIVLGLSASPASNNAYALILKELEGNRRLPIIIGAFEAQAIALELEGVKPPRPMTHDLLKTMIDQFNLNLSEVYINELKDGTFYAKLIFEDFNSEIDVRPSDAIAIAVRCNSPIYVNSDVLDETGVQPEGDELEEEVEDDELARIRKSEGKQPKQPASKLQIIQQQLDKAIADEDYEKAAKIRDEIKNLLGSS